MYMYIIRSFPMDSISTVTCTMVALCVRFETIAVSPLPAAATTGTFYSSDQPQRYVGTAVCKYNCSSKFFSCLHRRFSPQWRRWLVKMAALL